MKNFWRYLLLLIGAGIVLTPLLIALLGSFVENTAFATGNFDWSHLTLKNYALAFKQAQLPFFTMNSLIISLFLVAAQLLVASLAAYAFVFIDFRSRGYWFAVFLTTMMVPFESIFVSNFQLIKNIGLLDTYLGIGLPFVASAFSIFFLRQTFRQIPSELHEAAQIAGTSHFKFYSSVIMPMSKKALTTLAIYLFLSAWNMYLFPLLVSSNNSVRTVQIGLRQLQSSETLAQWGTIMAAAVLIIIPTLLILYLTQNKLQEGLAEGAVK